MSEGASGISLEQQPIEPQAKVRNGIGGFFERKYQSIKNGISSRLPDAVETVKLTPNERRLSDILYRSFEFSQGSGFDQENIFRYVHFQNPDLKMSAQEKKPVFESVQKKTFDRFYGPGRGPHMIDPNHKTNIVENKILSDLRDKHQKMDTILNNPSEEGVSEEELIAQIADRTIISDYKFLVVENGRPREKGDRFQSFLESFAGGTRNFAIPEIAQMYKGVREYFIQKIESGEWTIDYTAQPTEEELRASKPVAIERALSLMVVRWQQEHPGQKFMDAFAQEPNLQMAAD